MGVDDEFMIDPNSFDDDGQQFVGVPPNAGAAWILELIRIRLDQTSIEDEFKKELLDYMTPYLNLAGFTNISRGQVIEFWMGYQKIWTKYRIFMNPDKFDSKLIFLKDWILEMFMMMLNKSIDATQLKAVFEPRHIYDVKQRRETASEKVGRFFGKHKKTRLENEEGAPR
jgi:hypothetical protein